MKSKLFKAVVALTCTASVVLSAFAMQFASAAGGTVNDVPLANPYAVHTYGTGDAVGGLWNGMMVFERENTAQLVDATKAKYLEFDFFISDLANFKKNATERAGLVISLSGGGSSKWTNRAMYWFQDKLNNDGWNHIKLDISAPDGYNEGKTDFTKIFNVMVANGDALVNESPTVRVANVALTIDPDTSKLPAPALPANVVKAFGNKGGADKIMVDSLAAYNNFNWDVAGTPSEYNSAKYIEMDFFVEDYNKFITEKAGKDILYFNFIHGARDSKKVFVMDPYITNSGWNHAKIEIPNDVDLSKCYGYEAGPWHNYNGKFGMANVCLTKDTELTAPAKLPESAIELNRDIVEVPSLNAYSDFAVKRIEKTDYSSAAVIEFDAYVDDYAHFSTYKNGNDKVGIYLHLYSAKPSFDQELAVHTQITKSGWNHIRLPIDTEKVDMTQFTGYAVGPWESYDQRFAVANFCLTGLAEIVAPDKPQNIVKEMGMDVKKVDSLAAFNDFAAERFDKTDLSEARYIELDAYVDDYEHFSTYKNGNDKVGIYLHPYSSKGDAFDMELAVHTQITKSGWNHIRFEIDTEKVDMTQFTGYAIGPWESYDQRFAVANVCLTKDPAKPALPENITYLVDENGFSYRDWSGELVFKEYNKETYDLSESKFFEIDMYISDADYAVYEKDAQGIGFSIGSDSENKWKDRAVYQAKLNFNQAGWNHFKINIEDSSYWEGTPDFKSAAKVLLYHEGLHNITPITIRFVNACFTSGPQEAGPDTGETPAKPDKEAYYISDCETLFDNFGAWNSAGDFGLDSANHTEGIYSMRMKFNASYNSIRYNLNTPIDVSKADKLKFDIFIANEDVMKQFTDGFTARLASNGKYRGDYAYAELKEDTLKTGWNSIEVAVSDLLKDGNADLTNIDTFCLFSTNGSFGDIDELTVKLDNIRVSGTVTAADGGNLPVIDGDNDNNDGFDGKDDPSDLPQTGETAANIAAIAVLAACACAVFGFKKIKKTEI